MHLPRSTFNRAAGFFYQMEWFEGESERGEREEDRQTSRQRRGRSADQTGANWGRTAAANNNNVSRRYLLITDSEFISLLSRPKVEHLHYLEVDQPKQATFVIYKQHSRYRI